MAERPASSLSFFARAARAIANWSGQPIGFGFAIALIVGWGLAGPLFDFSTTWQLVINTVTSLSTFLMVFLIQSTQNRDATAMHLKLDELIRGTQGAHNIALDMEELPEHELHELRDRYQALATRARDRAEGELHSGSPDLDEVSEDLDAAADADADARTVDVLDRARAVAADEENRDR